MTYQVLKSRIRGMDFAADVAKFIEQWNSHAAHMKKVNAGEPDYDPYPAPRAHPEVMAAVRHDADGASADYEIVDDGPTAEQMLRYKKDHLLGVVSQMENDAVRQILPIGRRRLLQMRETDIRSADAERRKQVIEENRELRFGLVKELTAKHAEEISKATPRTINKLREQQASEVSRIGPDLSEEDIENAVVGGRPQEDSTFLAENAERVRKLEAVARHGAVLQHDIEDLTESEIDHWTPPPFPV